MKRTKPVRTAWDGACSSAEIQSFAFTVDTNSTNSRPDGALRLAFFVNDAARENEDGCTGLKGARV